MNHAMDVLREHTGKLFSINVVGTMTWIVESTNVFGLLAAIIGLFAGVMLVCIRWGDFMASKPVQWVKARWLSHKQGMD